MARVGSKLGGWGRYVTLFAGLLLLFVAGCLVAPEFLSIDNQRDVLRYVSVNGILAVGMTMVILTAGIDLSVGSVMSLCTVVCAMLLMQRPGTDFEHFSRAHALLLPALLIFGGLIGYRLGGLVAGRLGKRKPIAAAVTGVIAAVAIVWWAWGYVPTGFSTLAVLLVVPPVGGMMGMLSGSIIAKTRLQPFIVTLAMMISAVGLAKYVAGFGGQIHAIYTVTGEQIGAPESFEKLGGTILTVGEQTLRSGKVRELKLIPIPGLFLFGGWAFTAFLLHKLPLGRYIYAVGGNEETSRLSGVAVDRVKIFVYTASGFLAGLAAVLYCAQYTQGKADAGMMKELDAIAAVVIGGTSLMGGRGSILGTLVGVMIFGYLTNILQLKAVSSEIQEIVKGVIIVGAAALQSGNVMAGLRSLITRR
ncbi:MAG: ABC transporter permease [Planctomycetes bacterium]|nr:ABC transporter permease [Planctomycetota bacterium]